MKTVETNSWATTAVAQRGWRAAAWIAAYVALAAFPLVILLFGKMPRGGG